MESVKISLSLSCSSRNKTQKPWFLQMTPEKPSSDKNHKKNMIQKKNASRRRWVAGDVEVASCGRGVFFPVLIAQCEEELHPPAILGRLRSGGGGARSAPVWKMRSLGQSCCNRDANAPRTRSLREW